jgi:hypothetical protein
MKRKMLSTFFAAAMATTLAVPMFADGRVSKDTKGALKATLVLPNSVMFAGKELKPGNYQVVADQSTVRISKDGKLIAEAPAQMEEQSTKDRNTSVVLQGNDVKEIHFGGKNHFAAIQQ